MQHDLYGVQKKIWKLLRKKLVKEIVRINHISKEKWRTYFGSLYSAEQTGNNRNTDKTGKEIIEESQEELILETHEV